VETVGHEFSIKSLRRLYKGARAELDELNEEMKRRCGMTLDTKRKTNDEHAPLAAVRRAEAEAKAKANAADPHVRADQFVNDYSKDFVDETIVRDAVDDNV